MSDIAIAILIVGLAPLVLGLIYMVVVLPIFGTCALVMFLWERWRMLPETSRTTAIWLALIVGAATLYGVGKGSPGVDTSPLTTSTPQKLFRS